jgi:putative DNA primase/helicase
MSGEDITAPTVSSQSLPASEDRVSEKELARLAALGRLDYDREREGAAQRLGVRVTTLDQEVTEHRRRNSAAQSANSVAAGDILADLDPWPDSVDGAALLDALITAIARFCVLPPDSIVAIALWVMFAHAHDAAEHSPILALESPEKRCGKTTTLSIVADLVPRPLPAANISPAALFRAVEAHRPTLLIDEGDTFLRGDNHEMRGILNSGSSATFAYVLRCDGEQNEPRAFRTWCPKLIALIGTLPDTLQDRSIVVTLRRKLNHERVERYTRGQRTELHQLHAMCARWAADHLDRLHGADPVIPTGLNDRAADCWRPLLAIADEVGGQWGQQARDAAKILSGASASEEAASAGVLLLTHVGEVFATDGVPHITSTALANALNGNEQWPWGEWRHGRPITPRGIARILARYGIRPHKTRSANEYRSADFGDAWRRYVPPPAAPPNAANSTSSIKSKLSNDFNALTCDRPTFPSSTANANVELGSHGKNSRKDWKNNELDQKVELVENPGGDAGRHEYVNGCSAVEGEVF